MNERDEIVDELVADTTALVERENAVTAREAELPRLKAKAKEEGRREGLREAEQVIAAEVERRTAATVREAERAAQQARQQVLELEALEREIVTEIDAAGPKPEQPSADEVLRAIVDEMPNVTRRWMRSVKLREGAPTLTQLHDAFVRQAYDEHGLHLPQHAPAFRVALLCARLAAIRPDPRHGPAAYPPRRQGPQHCRSPEGEMRTHHLELASETVRCE